MNLRLRREQQFTHDEAMTSNSRNSVGKGPGVCTCCRVSETRCRIRKASKEAGFPAPSERLSFLLALTEAHV